MNDRYKHWSPSHISAIPYATRDMVGQVIIDLEKASSEAEKVEILDSYFAYAQRKYRAEEISNYSSLIGQFTTKIAAMLLSISMPGVSTPYRTAKAAPKEEVANE